MYSTCIFCNNPLGANEIIEEFPVGRRIAFDSAMGRLWVVCRVCERWNLSPLDERWEIIEQCERKFSETRMRVSTENIGLARLSEGLELVRVGRPMRPELAAWRYGDQFGRRRRKALILGGATMGTFGLLMAGSWAIGAGVAFAPNVVGMARGIIEQRTMNRVLARVPAGDRTLEITRKQTTQIKLLALPDGDWRLVVPDGKNKLGLTGTDAERALAQIMPWINREGASGRKVREAVTLIEHAGDPHTLFKEAAATAKRKFKTDLLKQPAPIRLALEMAAHEDAERRALEGELKDLERAWKEAEEIAAISDSLFTPTAILEKIERWRRG